MIRLLLSNVVFLLHLVHDYDKKIGNGTSSGGRHSWAQREKRLSDTFIQDGYDWLVMHDMSAIWLMIARNKFLLRGRLRPCRLWSIDIYQKTTADDDELGPRDTPWRSGDGPAAGSGLVWSGRWWPFIARAGPSRVPCAFLGRDMTADTRSLYTARRCGASSAARSEMIWYFDGTVFVQTDSEKLIPLHPFSWPTLCVHTQCRAVTDSSVSYVRSRGPFHSRQQQWP